MKKILIAGFLFGAFAFAGNCPEGDLKCSYEDGYSVMEAEEAPYGRHNWMEMQHHYADFVEDGCSRCGETVYKKAEDRKVAFVD